jgi:hypothetical protein
VVILNQDSYVKVINHIYVELNLISAEVIDVPLVLETGRDVLGVHWLIVHVCSLQWLLFKAHKSFGLSWQGKGILSLDYEFSLEY